MGLVRGWYFSSTITIWVVWHIGPGINIWTKARSPLTLHSASLTMNRHFKRMGMDSAVNIKWLSRLITIQRSAVLFLGGWSMLHLVDPVQETICTAYLSHWTDISRIDTGLYQMYLVFIETTEILIVHQQNVNWSGSHWQTFETLQQPSPVLPSTSRYSQPPLELCNVLSDSARAFSDAPESICSYGGTFRMLQE